jgi:hypothetical protein
MDSLLRRTLLALGLAIVIALPAHGDAPAPGKMLRAMRRGPLAGVDQIVFAVRKPVQLHYYENFGYRVCPPSDYPLPKSTEAKPGMTLFGEGGRLCRLHLDTGRVTVVLDDATGGIRDPQVHYSGQTILFSYRKGGQPYYHLFEIGVDGSGLRQLTDGPYDDIEPTYVPDGGILFCSSRCRRMVGCNPSPVATVYRCEADGSGIRQLSPNAFTDNTPWVLPDGRVLYTRWEYVDRNQMSFHHLWTTNPDGTAQMVFFGNQYQSRQTPQPRFLDVAMLDAKPIPGSDKIVASFSPDHGRSEHMGFVTIVDPRLGPDALESACNISGKQPFRDPYPLSEDCFLVADRRGIWLMDGQGTTELLYSLPPSDKGLECHEPRPLVARLQEFAIPSRVDLDRKTGVLVLRDVYRGRNMDGVQPGEIKRLLVLEQLPKPVNFSGGSEPLTIGGAFALERILGTVPVDPDGSAYFEAPAGRALFFVALDENDLSVKRMQSFLTVQPGETTGCVGCHERRLNAPHAMPEMLVGGRTPSRIEPIADVPDVFDYPRDIQPILDRHCTSCHNADRRDGGIELTGDRTPMFTVSYWTMITHRLISDGRNFLGNQPPHTIGSSASRLLKLGDGSHHDAVFSPQERKLVRLWIESGATYPGTYGALGSGIAMVKLPAEAIQRRCGECHRREKVAPYSGMAKGDQYQFGHRDPAQALVNGFEEYSLVVRLAYLKFGEAPPHQELCNLTEPEHSLLVRAPLARSAGGLELCERPVWADTNDPDYQQVLGAIREAAGRLDAQKRFDMPGFRPNAFYIRQMQTYGVLPSDLKGDASLDPYALDRAYWELLNSR